MTVVPAIRTRLLAISAVTAICSTRIYALSLPQSPTLPAIRVTQVSEVQPMHLRGSQGFWRCRVQVDCVAGPSSSDPYGTARSLAAAARGTFSGGAATGLLGYAGTVGGVEITGIAQLDTREHYEADELRQVMVSTDYLVFGTGLVS